MAEIPYFPTAPVMVLVGKLASEKLDFLEGRLKAGWKMGSVEAKQTVFFLSRKGQNDDDDDDDENAPDVFQLLVLLHQMPDSAEALMTPGKINACKIKDCGPLSPCAEEEW